MHKTSPSLQWIFTGLPPFSAGASQQLGLEDSERGIAHGPTILMGNPGIIIGILGGSKAYHGKTSTILEQVSNENQ